MESGMAPDGGACSSWGRARMGGNMIRHIFYILAVWGIWGQEALLAGPAGLPPYNDECHSAIGITDVPQLIVQFTADATSGEFDPKLPCGTPELPTGGHSVWFAFTPALPGRYSVNTFGSDYDTVLAVMTGPCAAYHQIACDDDTGGQQSQVFWDALADTTYYIEVVSYGSGPGGDLHLGIEGVPPDNDQCSNARPLLGPDGYQTQSIAFATTDSDEPGHACAPWNRTVWFSFVPQEPGVALLTTGGSNFDSVMAVYRGACGGPWRLVACNDDTPGALSVATWSELAVDVQAGEEYFVVVGSYSPTDAATLYLQHNFGPRPESIAEVRCKPLDTRVTLADVVLNGYFFGWPDVQQQDRASAMHISIGHHGPEAPGSVVTVTGMLEEFDGNLYLHDGGYVYTGSAMVTPLKMTTGTVGGYRSCRQSGRAGGAGPNNISLLVEVCGRVTGVEQPSRIYWVDDGCGLRSDPPFSGLRVWSQEPTLPAEGSYVRVIGTPWIWAPSYAPLLREFVPPEYVLGGPGPAAPLAGPAYKQTPGDPSVGM